MVLKRKMREISKDHRILQTLKNGWRMFAERISPKREILKIPKFELQLSFIWLLLVLKERNNKDLKNKKKQLEFPTFIIIIIIFFLFLFGFNLQKQVLLNAQLQNKTRNIFFIFKLQKQEKLIDGHLTTERNPVKFDKISVYLNFSYWDILFLNLPKSELVWPPFKWLRLSIEAKLLFQCIYCRAYLCFVLIFHFWLARKYIFVRNIYWILKQFYSVDWPTSVIVRFTPVQECFKCWFPRLSHSLNLKD